MPRSQNSPHANDQSVEVNIMGITINKTVIFEQLNIDYLSICFQRRLSRTQNFLDTEPCPSRTPTESKTTIMPQVSSSESGQWSWTLAENKTKTSNSLRKTASTEKTFFELILLLFVKCVYSKSINKRLLNWNIIRVQKNIWTIRIIIEPMLSS